MKKLFLILLATMLAGQVWADNFDFSAVCSSGQTLYYKITSSTTVMITFPSKVGDFYNGYTKPSGDLVIPETITYDNMKYSITSISYGAFIECSGLTTVVIPNSVTSIGEGAFYNCSGLNTVSIPNSVSSIGSSAFNNCSGLTSVTIPNSVSSIGSSAFYNCSGLTSVTIPNSVTSIGSHAFYKIKNIVYDGTASGCPWSAYTINGIFDGDFIYTDENKTQLTAYTGKGGIVTIPNTVTLIGNNAFEKCSDLKSIVIPNSVISIGSYAFNGCSGLSTVTISNSITSIGEGAFYNCSGLTSVTIPNSVSSIGGYAFYGCSGLSTIIIPNSVTSIGEYAFYSCRLSMVSIPKSVIYIGKNAFCGDKIVFYCEAQKRPDGWAYHARQNNKVHDSDAFWNDQRGTIYWGYFVEDGILYHILTQNTVSLIRYLDTKLEASIEIPSLVNEEYSVTSIITEDGGAFTKCPNMTSVSIPKSVTTIGNNTFNNCTNLTSVTIPKSVTTIGSSTFENCGGLTSIVIPNSVTKIGASAFKDCVNLTIYCQAKVKHSGWDDKWNINNCPVVWGAQLANVNITANNSAYGQVSGMGAYIDSTQVKILAIPNAGYIFVKWSDGNTENPRTIVASGDLDFTAVFEVDETQNGNENQGENNEGNENQGGENTNPGTTVAETAANAINIYAHHNTIIVENATDEIRVYNAMGALVGRDAIHRVRAELQVNGAGVYIVKVGAAAKRVMIND